MRRKLFNFAAAVSLVLCVAACGLWLRGYLVGDCLIYDGQWVLNSASYRGRIKVAIFDNDPKPAVFAHLPPGGWSYGTFEYSGGDRLESGPTSANVFYASGGGFTFWHGRPVPAGTPGWISPVWGTILPHWSIVASTAAVPLAWAVARAKRQRAEHGLCPACGYDLRATPGRCPECGSASRESPHNAPMQRTATAGAGAVE